MNKISLFVLLFFILLLISFTALPVQAQVGVIPEESAQTAPEDTSTTTTDSSTTTTTDSSTASSTTSATDTTSTTTATDSTATTTDSAPGNSAGQGQGQDNANTPSQAGGPQGGAEERTFKVIRLQFVGTNCDPNKIESILLRVDGVVEANIEQMKNNALVRYNSLTLTTDKIEGAVARSGKAGDCFTRVVGLPQ